MSRLAELQHSFFRYLLGHESDFVGHVRDQGAVSAATRADIYRNGYRLRLRDAINTDHDVLGYYLGDELFDRMVDGYIDRYPSHATTLRLYAEHLPEFLRENPPFCEHPVLAELAAFERMLLFAFDAPDAGRESADILLELPAERWPSMRFRFHPSMQFFPARWNSVEIWQTLKADQAPPVAASQPPRQWLLWRNRERITEFRPLENYEFELLQAALAGNDLAALCERLLQWYAPERVSPEALGLLRTWLSQGILRPFALEW
jgi:hypothetical protein